MAQLVVSLSLDHRQRWRAFYLGFSQMDMPILLSGPVGMINMKMDSEESIIKMQKWPAGIQRDP